MFIFFVFNKSEKKDRFQNKKSEQPKLGVFKMSEQYKDYYVKYNIKAFVQSRVSSSVEEEKVVSEEEKTSSFSPLLVKNATEELVRGYIFFGVRLQPALYVDDDFRQFCGLLTRQEVADNFKGATCKMIRTYSDAARITLVKSFNLELQSKTAGTVYAGFGDLHRTYLVVSDGVLDGEVSERLYGQDILVGPDKIPYTVTIDSLNPRSSRKTKKQL